MIEPMLITTVDGPVATLTMNRPAKRNAMCDELLAALDGFFSAPPEGIKAVVLTGTAGHYCSGLDLSEHVARDALLDVVLLVGAEEDPDRSLNAVESERLGHVCILPSATRSR